MGIFLNFITSLETTYILKFDSPLFKGYAGGQSMSQNRAQMT